MPRPRPQALGNPIANAIAAALRASRPPEPTKLDKMRSYRDDPVGFASNVLGIRLWSKQREVLEAVRDHTKVAIVSGQKTGKTTALVCVALWRFVCFPGARIHFTAPTEDQLKRAFWREVKRIVKLSCSRGWPIPGAADIAQDPRTGLRDPETFSELQGFTAREIEAVSGTSGDVTYIVDEASGVSESMFEGMIGNLLGGGSIILISNPSRNEGEFAKAFKDPNAGYITFEISAEDTPNCTGTEPPIRGLAMPGPIADMAKLWGRDSAMFRVRVLGQFVVEDESKAFPVSLIAACEQAWLANLEHEAEGRLVISCDPAGDSGEGDESVFTVRRGVRCIEQIAKRGLDAEKHLFWIRSLVAKHERPGDAQKPVLVLDAEGPIGVELFYSARAALGADMLVIGVKAGNPAQREPDTYETIRDELLAGLRNLARADKLEIPADRYLAQELNLPSFAPVPKGKRGVRYKATPKKEIRSALGRSPDRYDSLALAFWFRDGLRRRRDGTWEDVGESAGVRAESSPRGMQGAATGSTDPFASLDAWVNPFD